MTMDLLIFNPWWREGKVPEALVGKKRRVLRKILPYLELRQMLIFSGLRRVGKTTLMFQIINELLRKEKSNPYHILYFSFDETKSEVKDILDEYEKSVLKKTLSKAEEVYLFLDEVQKLEDWSEKIKIIYDIYPNIKIFLSGSAAISIKKSTKESLAGRFFEFHIEPLDFDEYLEFKRTDIDKEREDIFELGIRQSLDHFLKTGGFIEALNLNESQREKYFKESLLERVIYRDLPETFAITSARLLYQLIRLSAEKPGMYLDYKNIANDLGYDQRTIANYFSYLEYALLISKLYNYSPNFLTSEKKMKKLYLSNTAFTVALSGKINFPLLIEQFFANLFKTRFFSRTPQKDEVDLVIATDDSVIPIEVKIKPEIKKRDLAPLFKFLRKYKLKIGFVISEKTKSSFFDNGRIVELIPYWKYWSIKKKVYSHDQSPTT